MKKFLVLYTSSVSAVEQMSKVSPEQAKAGMDLWMSWAKQAAKSILDMGAPLGNAVRVAPESVRPSETKITGFSILQGESIKAVGESLKNHPHFKAPGASIEVLEFLSMPGMSQG